MHIINDANYKVIVAEGIAAGKSTGYVKGTSKLKMKFTDTHTVIPRDQWAALVKQGKGTFLSDLIKAAKIPSKDQDGLGYCWVYASTSTVETCRAVQGQPFVSLSPESVGGPITGWANRGGYGIDALQQLEKAGACASYFMDAPNSLHSSRWKAGWEADCANHKITNAWGASVDTFDEVFTALLLRLPVSIGLDWWGHQVILTDPVVLDNGGYGVMMRNSWGENWPSQGAGGWSVLTENKAQPDGSFAAISASTSDTVVHGPADSLRLVNSQQERVKKLIASY